MIRWPSTRSESLGSTGPGPVPGAARSERIADRNRARSEASPETVARARRGDVEAFGELARIFGPDVTRLCRRLLGSDPEAEDVSQETFLRAQRSLDGYDPGRSFRSWLLAIAAHRAIDHLRRRSAEHKLFEASELDADSFESPGPSPLQVGLRSELRQQIIDAIDAQPERYRAPLVLRFYAELDYDTIARLLDVSRNQVATLLFRGRRRLRESLEGRGTIS